MLVDLKDSEIEMINDGLDLLDEQVDNNFFNEFGCLGVYSDGTSVPESVYLEDVTELTNSAVDERIKIDNLRLKFKKEQQ